jgi:hypothetical protein
MMTIDLSILIAVWFIGFGCGALLHPRLLQLLERYKKRTESNDGCPNPSPFSQVKRHDGMDKS